MRFFITWFLCLSIPLHVTRYDEEQAQSENAERDLRSRSGQSLGSKGTKGGAGVRPVAATWKWDDFADSKWLPVYYYRVRQWGTVDKKRTIQTFLFSPPTEWRNAPCLHFWQGNDNSTWRKINNPDIFGEFKGWSLWLFVWISNWKWRNYVGGAEGQARSCISQQQQQQQQFTPHPKLHVKIKKNFPPKKGRRRRWHLGRGNSKRRSFFLSCSRSSRRKNG